MTDFLERLEKLNGAPVEITEEFYLPIVNSLWTMIQGERLNPEVKVYDEMMKSWHVIFYEFGRNIGQIAITNKVLMRLMEWTGVLHFQDTFKLFFNYLDPVIDQHMATLDKTGEPRDFMDRYLMEVQVKQTKLRCHMSSDLIINVVKHNLTGQQQSDGSSGEQSLVEEHAL